MAALTYFPTFFSLSSRKLFDCPIPSRTAHHHFTIYHHRLPPIYASSTKKSRGSRKVRSDTDLCNDIQDFVSAVGLPEGHVPSLKELSENGRQDLANIVRRRGYKLIRELLATSTKTTIGSDTEEDLTGKRDEASASEDESTGQDDKVKDLAEDVSLSSETPIMEDQSSSEFIDSDVNSDDKSSVSVETSSKLSLQEKAAEFIQNGELNSIEDDSIAEDGKRFIESQSPTELESSSVNEEQNKQVLCRTDAKILTGSSTLSSQPFLPSALENGTSRNDYFSTEGQLSADCNDDLDAETSKKENQVEINRLKFMLHKKELELSQLKQQIEKEKLALSNLQTKAETEINKAQKLISVKDAEIHTAEDNLSGLEEVQIQYCGDGETVEVAGSFNGWHHRIKMDPKPSSSIVDPIESRKSKLWRTVLWLYPGIYEIKFVVDGHWRIDPQRESVARGTIQNNILRVDR